MASGKVWNYQESPSLNTSTVNYKTETPEDLSIQQRWYQRKTSPGKEKNRRESCWKQNAVEGQKEQ